LDNFLSLSKWKQLLQQIISDRRDFFVRLHRYGPYAGWAHSLFFAAELPTFRALLPRKLQAAMAQYAEQEKKRKQAIKTKSKSKSVIKGASKPPPKRKKKSKSK